jgi:predicted Zn-dependent peptidase
MYKKIILDNGIRCLIHPIEKVWSSALGVWVGVGSRYEDSSLCGISHFLEHLLFKGTKSRTGKDIKRQIEGVGGTLNGFTSEEFTCYLVKIQKKYLSQSLDVLMDMVCQPRLTARDIEKEKAVVLEEIKLYKDLPSHFVGELASQLLWPDHPLSWNITGEFSTISSMDRDKLLAFKDRFYYPANILLVATGALEVSDFIKQANRFFKGRFRSGKKPRFLPFHNRQARSRVKFHFKETNQVHLCIGTHALRRSHPDRYVVSLIHIILGANMSSRLFEEVREKRSLAYEISTSVKRFKDTGAFIVHAGVDVKRTREAIKVIVGELFKLKRRAITNQELRRAKEYFSGQLVLSLEDTLEHMLWAGESEMSLNKVIEPEQILDKVNKISQDDILRVSQNLFQAKTMNLALLGPLDEKSRAEIERDFLQL